MRFKKLQSIKIFGKIGKVLERELTSFIRVWSIIIKRPAYKFRNLYAYIKVNIALPLNYTTFLVSSVKNSIFGFLNVYIKVV
jgi:hypothetical protein